MNSPFYEEEGLVIEPYQQGLDQPPRLKIALFRTGVTVNREQAVRIYNIFRDWLIETKP